MGFDCKFACEKHPQRVIYNVKNHKIADRRFTMFDGDRIRYCILCKVYFKDTGKTCPCCGANTRKHGRSKHYKKKREALIKRY